MGSKARFTKEILPIILKDRKPEQWYVEPFAGGMNAICEVQGNRIANDVHYHLIQMWRELVGGWIPKKYTREEHKQIEKIRINTRHTKLLGSVLIALTLVCILVALQEKQTPK